MRVLVVYDTVHGNTQQVAEAIAEGLRTAGDVAVKKMQEAGPDDVGATDLLVVGSPTHAWNMSSATKQFFSRLGDARRDGKAAASFDTKFEQRLAGSAAGKMARALRRLGFRLVSKPENFYVAGMQGPLKPGELERARDFGASLAAAMKA
jgi:flavodoxin